MDIKPLQNILHELKAPPYRLKQALRAYYQDLLADWSAVSTWPKELRQAVSHIAWSPLKLVQVVETENPASAKLLFELPVIAGGQGGLIESVIMRHKDGRNTVCISSQSGCAMGCAFCATGALGLGRNLTAEEVVDQVIQAARWLKERGGKVTNIVFMGMGEPFNNPDEVFAALKGLMDPEMFGLGARHISISTCGIIPGIQRLAKEAPQVNLAISLHAADQNLRAKLMPVAKAYPLDKLMHALRDYLQRTNRKVMFEYVLLKGVNDREEDAEGLADLLVEIRHLAHVNLIKFHPASSSSSSVPRPASFEPSNQETRRKFGNILKRRGIAVTERISFGEEIAAACGQLAGQPR